MKHQSGRHFLQIPGPTNVPDRVLRAIDSATVDHRGPEFQEHEQGSARGPEAGVQDEGAGRDLPRFRHRRVGSGARQHALAGRPRADVRDRPLRDAVAEHGEQARAHRPSSSRATGGTAPIPPRIEARLAEDKKHEIKAVCVVHNETSTGVTSRIGEVRKASTARSTRRSSWSTRSPRSLRSTTATTNGAWTSPSRARRKG